ncbi:endonuclease NucS domain-containing protein [Deinococcus koreensis]|uniref:Endonuclease NucS n=1 Tax=Deinococcus koreensis TaxID=2054903 RepID=A0A2K3US77_9DEIO|nr:endonuclease NucS domain-containing protein [Deinococcus koreensis]PNY79399.1 endonuclease NucS [Deinococcus koreensis]
MIREQLTLPAPEALAAFLNRHTRTRDCLVQVAGLAEVTYRGRAASTADVGTYLVLVKQDGSLQIHHPTGIKPMNWQPKTDELLARVDEDVCMLLASRRSPLELVQVVFLLPQVALALELQEAGAFVLSGSEAQMQETLARTPELIEPGLRVLDRELLVESGGIDLYAQDGQGRFVVVELKRARATQHAVSQLGRYVRSVQGTLPVGAVVRGILAAPSITGPARVELERRGLEFREISAIPTLATHREGTQPSLFD